MRRLSFCILILSASFNVAACEGTAKQSSVTDSFEVIPGVFLPVIPNGKLQDTCEILGEVIPAEDMQGISHCIEFPVDPLGDGTDGHNWYAGKLVEAGFVSAGGASIQYWFDWKPNDKCTQRLNLTGFPKTKPENLDVWKDEKVFVAAFEALEMKCEN